MIPKSPIMVISDRFVKKRLPHNHQPTDGREPSPTEREREPPAV